MKQKVFIVSDGGHDYSDATKYGDLVFCTDRLIRKDDTAQMYREINESLDNAQAEDFILVSSLTSMCMIASAIMAAKFGEVHMLIHKDGQYVQRDLVL